MSIDALARGRACVRRLRKAPLAAAVPWPGSLALALRDVELHPERVEHREPDAG